MAAQQAGPSTAPADRPTVPLTNERMAKFKPAKLFKAAVEPPPANSTPRAQSTPRHITSMSFDDSGGQLVTAGEDDAFRLYSAKTGKHKNTFYSKKYGVDLIRFTHKSTNVLHTSNKENDDIRYHSMYDNKYITYFKGHTKRVISVEVSPADDGFISSSMDSTVRLWDLRTPHCRGVLQLPGDNPIVAYDSAGLVFAVGVNQFAKILLYDNASFDKEPFLTITLHDPTLARISFPPRNPVMTSLSFSSNSDWLLVGTSSNAHYILDAFDGHLLAKLEGHEGLERGKTGNISVTPQRGISSEEVSWTPDSRYVVGGSHNGRVLVWDIAGWAPRLKQRLEDVKGLPDSQAKPEPYVIPPLVNVDGHTGPSRCVKFNPRVAMMATAGPDLAFWLPDLAGDSEAKDVKMKNV
ncbi:WD40-repeat-containing domain protein [Auriculariales sp. MPI-PUGE-AT-0066]|nr:WD40-repeat-containing domain protein [Auriculariales sp. MPI-PUGE-AT-0066]